MSFKKKQHFERIESKQAENNELTFELQESNQDSSRNKV